MTEDFLFTKVLFGASKKESCYNSSASVFSLDCGRPPERSVRFWRDRKHISRAEHLEDTRVPAAEAELSGPPALGSAGLSPGPESPAAVGPVVSARTARRLSLWPSAAAHRAPPAELPGCHSPEIPPEDRNRWVNERCLNKEDSMDKAVSLLQSWK